MTQATTFQAGRTYWTRSICDHDCIFRAKVIRRTEKTVTITINNETVRRGISIYNGIEQFYPFGRYSMAAVIGADEVEA